MSAVTLNLFAYFIAFTVAFFALRMALLPPQRDLFAREALISYVLTLGASAVLVFIV